MVSSAIIATVAGTIADDRRSVRVAVPTAKASVTAAKNGTKKATLGTMRFSRWYQGNVSASARRFVEVAANETEDHDNDPSGHPCRPSSHQPQRGAPEREDGEEPLSHGAGADVKLEDRAERRFPVHRVLQTNVRTSHPFRDAAEERDEVGRKSTVGRLRPRARAVRARNAGARRVTPDLFEHEEQREETTMRELAGVERGDAQDRQRRRSERRDTGTIQSQPRVTGKHRPQE